MIGGTGPPPPLEDHPNGINISYPDYSFDTDIWHEPPKETNESFINNDTMTLRSNNDTAYKTIGNATTWHRYITFGYHSYDHCFQFDTQWDECDTLKFIWHTYQYHQNRSIDIPIRLERWAIDIAKPYLTTHLPTALNPDVTDPRNARHTYLEPDLMDVDESDSKSAPTDSDTWTEVPPKHKPRHIEEATAIPLPDSPARTSLPKPPTPPPLPAPTPINPEPSRPVYVPINDGTNRITIKWKPDNYAELSDDDSKWNYAATDLIHFLLATAQDSILFPWINGTTITNIPFIELTPDNLLLSYLAPKITFLPSMKMFVFSVRICFSSGPMLQLWPEEMDKSGGNQTNHLQT